MKIAFRQSLFVALLVCLCCFVASAQTRDPFIVQISASSAGTFARDISGNGRFVVMESAGNIATVNPDNADGNREIFLFDDAQRRIFQITHTRSALVDATRSATDASNIAVEVSNNRPLISHNGKWIVFSSNAPTPASFDGTNADNRSALQADGNQELFLYRVPDVTDADLSSGADLPIVDLGQGAFTRLTNTPASRLPQAGTSSAPPFVADDNRSATINDLGTRVAFISTRNLPVNNGLNNPNGVPQLFIYNRLTNIFTQVTNSQGQFAFNDNPSISGDTTGDSTTESQVSNIAFISNDNIPNTGASGGNNSDANAEIYLASFNGSAVTAIRQVTSTRNVNASDIVNTLSPGRRLSRDGNLIAFESFANNPKGNGDQSLSTTSDAVFIYNVSSDTFTLAVTRQNQGESEVVQRFPTFTGDSSRLIFNSTLNLRPDGTRADGGDAAGLNPNRLPQIFSVPVATPNVVTRLSNFPSASANFSLQPFASDTPQRLAFSLPLELGGGNSDNSFEAFYVVTPNANGATDTTPAAGALAYFTGASQRDVATPNASPSPTPGPVTGLAPGMIAFLRATPGSGVTLAPSAQSLCAQPGTACAAGSESQRSPSLPVELNGVSLSINNVAAGLYSVSPSEIQFVVPPGLAATSGANTDPVVVSVRSGNSVTIVRSAIQIVGSQPDIFTSTNGPGGRAAATNVTNPLLSIGTPEPFAVTTTYTNAQGASVTEATRIRLILTGVRGVARAQVTVRLVRSDNTNVDVTGDSIPTDALSTGTPGVFQLDFRLPASLAGAGDVAVIVIVNGGGQSRPADTAPKINIQ